MLPSNPELGHGRGTVEDYFSMRERKQRKAKKAADDDATGSGTKNDKVPGTNFPDL